MSYTAWKKLLKPGVKLQLHNYRRPWLSREVLVKSQTRRELHVLTGLQPTLITLPPAALTHMTDDGCELLAKKDGPRWNDDRQVVGEILAGMPWMKIVVVS